MNKELIRCDKFLLENGWKKDTEEGEEITSYYRQDCINVDIYENEIVFIDDSGDFLHVPLNYYTLVGVLMEYHQIDCGYISTRYIN